MTTTPETGFNDPTAQRLERITTGAEPDVVGPLLADVLHDPRWLQCDVALISGGKSNLTYRVACDAGEVILRRPPLGHILPTAHDMVREYRVLTALDGTVGAGPAHRCTSATPTARSARRSTSWSASSATSAATSSPRATPTRPRTGARSARRSSTCSRACTPSIRRPSASATSAGPAGFMERQLRRWSKQWEASRVDDLPALDALRDALVRSLPEAARPRDRPRRLPARQHRPASDAARPDRRRARLGDEHARRPVHRPRRAAGVLERRGRRRGAHDGADRAPRSPRSRASPRAPRSSSATRARRASTSPTPTGTSRSRSSSSPSSARASPPARPAAPWSAPASTTPSAWSRRSSTPAVTSSAAALNHGGRRLLAAAVLRQARLLGL